MAQDRNTGSLRDRQQAALKEMQNRPKVLWPSWRYGPKGQAQIFQSEDEVPEGWVDHPKKLGQKKQAAEDSTEFQAGHIGDDNEDVKWLMDPANDATIDVIVATFEEINEDEDDEREIEFLKSWPKAKLAKTVVLNDALDEVKANIEDE